MGHTRLGEVPKTHKWKQLVERISGSGRTGNVATADVSVSGIAAQTLDATQEGLKRAANDPGVRYTFYLIAQVALAARTSNWERALGAHGIRAVGGQHCFRLHGRDAERHRSLRRFESLGLYRPK